MPTKVGINGFGRIGRQVLKAVRDYYPNTLEVVAFNDIGDLKTMAHLLKYDSNYGHFNGTVEVGDDKLIIDGKPIQVFKETDPSNLAWGDLGVAPDQRDLQRDCVGTVDLEGHRSAMAGGERKIVAVIQAPGSTI